MTTIVWIHGFPLSSEIFEAQKSIDGVRHVMPDLPGFGGEPLQPINTMDDYARFILEQVDGDFIAAGLSMGGYIAFAIARLAPERLQGLILLATRETADDEKQRQGRYDMIEKVRAEGVTPVVEAMLPKMLTADAPDDMRERARRIMASSTSEGVIAALGAIATRPDSTALLPSLHVPVLIVVGEDDPITPPVDAERMARAFPNATLVRVPGAAHLVTVQKPEDVNAAVRNYVESAT